MAWMMFISGISGILNEMAGLCRGAVLETASRLEGTGLCQVGVGIKVFEIMGRRLEYTPT
jgi:hypothetical protein